MSGARLARDRLDRILSILLRSLRFWRFALIVGAVGCAGALGYALKRPRVYKSETLILYREAIRSSALGEEVGGDPARRLGMRLKEMVLSRTRLQQVIEEFRLYPALVEDRGYVDAVDEMRGHIAFRVRDGDTFGLSFEGNDPKLVQAVTARLAEALIEENSKHRVEQATVTKDFLDAETERVEEDLKQKETDLTKFLAAHPEFARQDATSTLHVAKPAAAGPVKEKDADLLALEREAARIEARLGMPRRAPDKPVEKHEASKMQQDAEAELQAAQKDLADKLSRFTDQHPDVRAARARLRGAEAKLAHVRAAESDLLTPAVEVPAAVDDHERADLGAQLVKVNADIASFRARIKRNAGAAGSDEAAQQATSASRIVALETEWTRISRDVADARQRRAQLEDKQFKAGIAASSASSEHNAQIAVVDPAYLPTHPAKPGRALIVAVGVAVSALLAFGLSLGRALIDDRIYDRVDVEQLGLLPLVAVIPRPPRGQRAPTPGSAATPTTGAHRAQGGGQRG